MAEIHTISEYEKLLRGEGLAAAADIPDYKAETVVNYVSYDTRDMKSGTLFVCKGAHFKDEYLADALEHGAIGYVAEKVHAFQSDFTASGRRRR